MQQHFIMEIQEDNYVREINRKLQEGYKLVVGSTCIKSLPTDIDIEHGTLLHDVEHVFTVAIRGQFESVIFSNNFITLTKEVNKRIKTDNFNFITGSMSINLKELDGYISNCSRSRITYYCCCLYKE